MRVTYIASMRAPMEFSLRSADKRTLSNWLRSTTLPQDQITRAKIILALDRGWTPTAVAQAQQVSAKSVHKWRNRYLEAGIDGLYDQPCSGRPMKITENIVKHVLDLTTQYVPEEATQCSVELMAKHAQITTWQVRQIGKAADLKPHRLKTFKISNEEIERYIEVHNRETAKPCKWTKDAKSILLAVERAKNALPN